MTQNEQHHFLKGIGAIALIGLGLSALDTVSKGGCDAADREEIRRLDAENKAWQREQDQKAHDADVEEARRRWDAIPSNH